MLWIALHLPHFVLDTLTPNWRTEPAFVYAGKGSAGRTVVACSPMAKQAGIRKAMPVASASGLSPQASMQPLDAHRLAVRFNTLAALMLPYTPCIVQAQADTLLLEVSASLALFGGLRALRRQLAQTLSRQGLSYRLATAPSANGAWLLAVHPGRHLRHALSGATLARRLDGLHCRYLPAAQPHLDWLDGIGSIRLGTMRRLPRAELQRRTSPALLHALDCVYGCTHDTHLVWYTSPRHFHHRLELPVPCSSADMLLAAARRLLQPLRHWLAQHQLAATRISLLFEHDARRHATPFTPLMLQSARPVWQPEDWLRLLQAHLAHLSLPAPVLALRLQTQLLQDRPGDSAALLPAPGGQDMASYHDTLALLAARVGPDALLQAAARSDHRPEAANVWLRAPAPADRAATDHTAGPAPAHAPTRPCWLLDTPRPLATQGRHPVYQGPLILLSGPERIEDGWWETPMRRDYYVAQSAQGVCYWVFRTTQGWFLHGLFG